MDCRSKLMPSFFKILITDDFTTQLALPPHFVQQNRDTLPSDAKLQSVNEQTWYVKIENVGHGKHCFTKGWSEFVISAKLTLGQFLVFWFDCGNSTFHVSAYGLHGCGYEIPGCNKTRVISDDDKSSEDQPIGHGGNEYARTSASDSSSPRLEVGFERYQRFRVVLSKGFGKHLIGKEFVVMEYTLTQRSKKVMLHDCTKRRRGFRLALGSGWNDFHKENGLKFGKSYLFVYNRERDVIQVSPVEKDLHFARKLVDRCNVDPESPSARVKRKYVRESSLEDYSDDDSGEDQPVKVQGKNKMSYMAGKSATRSDRYNQVDPESSSARIQRMYWEENVSENYGDSDDDSSEVKIAVSAGHYVEETVSENDDDGPSEDQSVETHGLVKKKAAMTSVFDNSPQFEVVLKEYQISRVILGKEFMEKAGLLGKKTVNLMYAPTQRSTKVLLDNSCSKNKRRRHELAMGWSDFRKENGLVFGKSYSFVYNRERNLILVRPIENKSQVKKKHKQSSVNPVTGSYRSNMDPHSWSSGIKNYTEGSSTEDDDDDGERSEDEEPEKNGFLSHKQKLKNEIADEIVLKEWILRRMPLHKEFAEKAHLIGKKSVILEYAPTRNSTRVLLSNCSTEARFKLMLTTNWPEFQKDNGLKVGATYLFTFNRARNVIEVQPVKEKCDKMQQ